MDVNTIASTAATTASKSSAVSSYTSLSRQDFMNIMISEMSHQDPMNPVENQDFLNQLAQLESLQAMAELTQGIEALLRLQHIGSASALIGRQVAGSDSSGNPVSGTVEKVVMRSGQAAIVVDGTELPLERITEVQGD